jgi:hypothetical protein
MKPRKRTTKKEKEAIPDEIKAQVEEIIRDFNLKVLKGPNCYYVARYKGNYLYLDRYKCGRVVQFAD